MHYRIPKVGDGVWDAHRTGDQETQPNGEVISVDLENEKVRVRFYKPYVGDNEYEKEYELDELIGCWHDRLNQFHINT